MSTLAEDQLEEHGKYIAVVDGTRPTGEPREDLVNTATAFLLNPRVQQSSDQRKRAFLVKKGLTPVEIEMAIARSLRPPQLALNPTRAPRSWVDALGSTIMGIAVIGSAAYGLYWVFKTYVEPRLIVSGPGPLERSIIELVAVVRQMGEDRRAAEIRADEQNARVIQLLNDLRQDVTSLKGVLVARSQFPAPPVTASIPSWQRSHATSIETTPINTNKTSTSAPSATSSVAPATEEMVNGTINGKLAENDAKQVIFASNESTVSSSNGDHKENVTENSQQLQQNKPNLNDSIKAKSQRPKSKKADLEV